MKLTNIWMLSRKTHTDLESWDCTGFRKRNHTIHSPSSRDKYHNSEITKASTFIWNSNLLEGKPFSNSVSDWISMSPSYSWSYFGAVSVSWLLFYSNVFNFCLSQSSNLIGRWSTCSHSGLFVSFLLSSFLSSIYSSVGF